MAFGYYLDHTSVHSFVVILGSDLGQGKKLSPEEAVGNSLEVALV